MEERQTQNTVMPLLVGLANGDVLRETGKRLLLEARKRTAGMDFFVNPSSDEAVFRILRAIAGHILDQLVHGAHNVVYGEHVASLGLSREGESHNFRKFDTTATFKPIPGLGLQDEAQNDVQVAYRLFQEVVQGQGLASERIGRCYCGRFFVSSRMGQRKSKACSSAHQAALSTKKQREKKGEAGKEAHRVYMNHLNEAKRLVYRMIGEGMGRKEVVDNLRQWNKEKGSPLKEKALNTILEDC